MELIAGKQIFNDNKEIFIINGLVNDNLTAPLVNLNSESVKKNRHLLKRLSYFTIECFQNVIRHGHAVNKDRLKMTKGMFAYINGANSVSVCTSNEVPIEHALSFEEKLKDLKTLSSNELKKLYVETLDTRKISDAGGAGLGLIDILRKTKGKVNFEFTPEINGWSNFMFETTVEGVGFDAENVGTLECQSFMELNDLLLFRQGVITRSSFLPICQLISLELQINNLVGEDRFLFSILELIQNVCDHSITSEVHEDCMFLKKTNEHVFEFFTGNLVEVNKVEGLTEKIDKINSLNKQEIQNEYERQISMSLLESLDKSELGLLKIRRKLGNKVQFRFEDYSDELTYLYLGISSE